MEKIIYSSGVEVIRKKIIDDYDPDDYWKEDELPPGMCIPALCGDDL